MKSCCGRVSVSAPPRRIRYGMFFLASFLFWMTALGLGLSSFGGLIQLEEPDADLNPYLKSEPAEAVEVELVPNGATDPQHDFPYGLTSY